MPLLKSYEDEEAFERLYHQYLKLMLYTAYQILQNSEDAEDAVQTAFLRIATHFSSVEKNICPKTANQFVIIVRNIAIDMYRKKKRKHLPRFWRKPFRRTSAQIRWTKQCRHCRRRCGISCICITSTGCPSRRLPNC